MTAKLANEIMDAANGAGASVKRRAKESTKASMQFATAVAEVANLGMELHVVHVGQAPRHPPHGSCACAEGRRSPGKVRLRPARSLHTGPYCHPAG